MDIRESGSVIWLRICEDTYLKRGNELAVSHNIACNFKLIDMAESDHVYILKVRARNLQQNKSNSTVRQCSLLESKSISKLKRDNASMYAFEKSHTRFHLESKSCYISQRGSITGKRFEKFS